MARKTARGLLTWNDITITLSDGRTVSGTYGCSDRYVVVKTALGSKTTHIGDTPPAVLARIMLRELADREKPRRQETTMSPKEEDCIRFYRDAVVAGHDDPAAETMRRFNLSRDYTVRLLNEAIAGCEGQDIRNWKSGER